MAIPFLNNITLNNNEIQNVRLQNAGSPPLNSGPGQIYFNSTDNVARYYNGTAWVDIPRQISVGGTSLAESQAIDLVAGANVGIAESSGTITISSTDQFQGTVTSVGASTAGDALDVAVTNATTTPDLDFTWAGAVTDYVNGEGDLVPFPTIPGAYTWSIQGDSGGPTAVASGDIIDFAGGTNVTTALSGTTLTINATDTNDNDYLTALSFNTGDGVLTATVQNQSDVTVDLDGRYLELAGGTMTGEINMGSDKITNLLDPTNAQDAATKAYVDNLVDGGLTFKDGFNANTGAIDGGGNLYPGVTRVAISVGDYYVVTTAGDFYGDSSYPLTVGDSVIAKEDALAGASVVTDWVIIQGDEGVVDLTSGNGGTSTGNALTSNTTARGSVTVNSFSYGGTTNVGHVPSGGSGTTFLRGDGTWVTPTNTTPNDATITLTAGTNLTGGGDFTTDQSTNETIAFNLATADGSTVGAGNVKIDGAGDKDGLSLAYASGTATVGLDITNLPNLSVAITAADLAGLEIPLYNGDTSDANEKIEVATLLSAASSQISYANTITDTATLSHGLASSDVMVQLYDITTGETVYADVDRISTTQVTITFATTPTNSVRVLIQKIG